MIRNQKQQIERFLVQMEKAGLEQLVLCTVGKIYEATGFFSFWAKYLPASTLAVVNKDGKVTLICSRFESSGAELATANTENIERRYYSTWIYLEDYDVPGEKKAVQPDPLEIFKIAAEVVKENGDTGKIGVQKGKLNVLQWEGLSSILGADRLVDCTHTLELSTMIKTPWEIEQFRTAATLLDKAMKKFAETVVPGMSFAQFKNSFERICLEQGDFVYDIGNTNMFGPYYTPMVIAPKAFVEAGDVVRLDAGLCFNGYGSDLARTFAVGKADKRKEEIFDTLLKAYKRGIEMIGPGVKLCDVFTEVMAICKASFPNYIRGHFGHSLGCSDAGEEFPFIAPNNDMVFEPGMVINLEVPYYGSKSNSYNFEDTLLITENGVDRFTYANETLNWPEY